MSNDYNEICVTYYENDNEKQKVIVKYKFPNKTCTIAAQHIYSHKIERYPEPFWVDLVTYAHKDKPVEDNNWTIRVFDKENEAEKYKLVEQQITHAITFFETFNKNN